MAQVKICTWITIWLGEPDTLWRCTSGAFSLCCRPMEVRGCDLKVGELAVSGSTNSKPTDTSTHTKVLSPQAHLLRTMTEEEVVSKNNLYTKGIHFFTYYPSLNSMLFQILLSWVLHPLSLMDLTLQKHNYDNHILCSYSSMALLLA